MFVYCAVAQRYPLKHIGDWDIHLAYSTGKPTSRLDSATIMVERTVLPNNIMRVKHYSLTGPMIRLMDLRFDTTKKNGFIDGLYIAYKPNGVIDTLGQCEKNVRIGSWYAYNDSAKAITKIVYKNGRKQSVEALEVLTKEEEEKRKKACTTCKPASYSNGGNEGWKKHISIVAEPTQRYVGLKETLSRFKTKMLVNFIVDSLGKVTDAYMLKSVEWSMDKKVTDGILNGGNWIPETKDGIPVKAYHTQPVTIFIHTGK